MDRFDHIPAEVESHTEAWYSFPQSFTVPGGWYYKQDTDREYQYAAQDLTIDLFCAGDWLEIVSEAENKRIIYEIV